VTPATNEGQRITAAARKKNEKKKACAFKNKL
jgi:hypothetical protein